MASSRKSKTKQTPVAALFSKQLLKPALILAVFIILILQLGYDLFLFQRIAPGQNTSTIVTLITQSLKSVHKPATIEPLSRKVYLPDASLVLPPAPDSLGQSEILYNYSPSIDNSDAEASVTLSNALNSAISKLEATQTETNRLGDSSAAVFKQVPAAQACSRGVRIIFGDKTKDETLEFSTVLADGRTMNLYLQQNRDQCHYNLQPLVDYLKQAQSY